VELYMGRRAGGFSISYQLPMSLSRKLMTFERFASRRLTRIKDLIPLIVVAMTVIVPIAVVLNSVILYWSADPYTGKVQGGVLYQLFGPSNYFASVLQATLTSMIVALTSTYTATCIAIPLAFIIERRWYGDFIRTILKVPLIIPAYEGSEIQMYEDSARTLGATAYDAIETVSLPLIKGGVITGFILSFTRSLGETGATFIVMGRDVTVPALVVNMVEALAIPAALFTSTYLIALSLVLLGIIRIITRR